MKLTITSIEKVPAMVLFKGATHVVSLLTRLEFFDLKMPQSFNKNNWLRLEMDDVIDKDAVDAPTKAQVETLLAWTKDLPEDAHLVVHCKAGVSRSTAAAFSVLVQRMGVDKVKEALDLLLDIRPIACPNPVITQFADELLGANGMLHNTSEEMVSHKLLELWGAEKERNTK